MIKVRNLTKSYQYKGKRIYIFKDINFTINNKESIGLLGRNGAGKSTLLRILGGIDFADSGTIEKDCSISWPFGVAAGFQGSLSAKENIKFVSKIYGTHSNKKIKEQIDIVREFADIGEYFDRPYKTYSSGMKGRISFGLSLAFKFDVYLLDEVIAKGDSGFKEKCKKALKELKKTSSFIIVSHNNDFLKKYIDFAYLIDNQTLTAYQDVSEAIKVTKHILNNKKFNPEKIVHKKNTQK